MSKRKCNYKGYVIFAKTTKGIREHCSPDPLSKMKNTGVTGKAIGEVGDKIIEKTVQKMSYTLTNSTYNKKTDNPCKGSAMYTAWYMGIKFALKTIAGIVLAAPALAGFIRFLNADLWTQAKMTCGIVPLFLIVYGIIKFKNWIKKNFKKK